MKKSAWYFRVLSIGIILFCWSINMSAAVKLPCLISDNMVIQSGKPLKVWGWADKDELVTVTIDGKNYTAVTDENGRWKVVTTRFKPGRMLQMEVTGSSGNKLTVKNILVGEVWICSGQSNMHWTLSPMHGVINNEAELEAANYSDIRMFTVEKKGAPEPAEDVNGRWVTISRDNLLLDAQNGASAIAYFFGRELYQKLNIPVGLINTSLGGTGAERWTSREALEADPQLKSLTATGCDLYNKMIVPLISFPIRGAIWYQGEANVDHAFQYRTLFPVMISSWRSAWGQGDFPFYFVQLAPFKYQGPRASRLAELWESQLLTFKNVRNTGMVVTTDIGNLNDIHPRNKQEVGRRLALWALHDVYGNHQLVCSGPVYKSMSVKGGRIVIKFDLRGSTLASSDGKPLSEFTIAGADQTFLPANAEISGNTVVVWNDQLKNPAAVRFAWRDEAQPNLANIEGLPASPFRTDNWKCLTEE